MNSRLSRVVLPFYLPEQYELLLNTIDDADQMEKTWEEWYKNHLILKNQMIKQEIDCVEVVIDVNELNDYCLLNQNENTKTNRDIFVLKLSCQ